MAEFGIVGHNDAVSTERDASRHRWYRAVGRAVCALMVGAIGAGAAGQSPDALYADRENLASARKAAELWSEALARGPTHEAAWKLARARYWLGGHAPAAERRALFEQGIDAARRAVALDPGRPEGHFWMAANMGALAESYGLRVGLKYRSRIKDELEFVLRTAPDFEQGSADRALGRWYFKVPAMFGGSKTRAEAHLRQSLTDNPHSTASHFFLAELLLDSHRNAEAREELHRVIDAPLDPGWAPEDREFQQKARDLIGRIR